MHITIKYLKTAEHYILSMECQDFLRHTIKGKIKDQSKVSKKMYTVLYFTYKPENNIFINFPMNSLASISTLQKYRQGTENRPSKVAIRFLKALHCLALIYFLKHNL